MARDAGDLKRVFSWVAPRAGAVEHLAPVVAGLLIDHVGFRAAFAFGALLPLVAVAAAWRVPRSAVPAGDPTRAPLGQCLRVCCACRCCATCCW